MSFSEDINGPRTKASLRLTTERAYSQILSRKGMYIIWWLSSLWWIRNQSNRPNYYSLPYRLKCWRRFMQIFCYQSMYFFPWEYRYSRQAHWLQFYSVYVLIKSNNYMKILFTGDVTLGRILNNVINWENYTYVWGDTLNIIRSAYLSIICVIRVSVK